MEPNTYKYATFKLRNNFDLAKFFLERGRSFNLLDKSVRNIRKIALTTVQINPKHYQNFKKQVKDDDEIL